MICLPSKELEDSASVLAYLKALRPVKSFFYASFSIKEISQCSFIRAGFAGVISSPSVRHDNVPKGCRNHYPSFPKKLMPNNALIPSWTKPSSFEVPDTLPPFSESNT